MELQIVAGHKDDQPQRRIIGKAAIVSIVPQIGSIVSFYHLNEKRPVSRLVEYLDFDYIERKVFALVEGD